MAALPLPFGAITRCFSRIVEGQNASVALASPGAGAPLAGSKRTASAAALGEPGDDAATSVSAPSSVAAPQLVESLEDPLGMVAALRDAQTALFARNWDALVHFYRDPRHSGPRWTPPRVAHVSQFELSVPPPDAAGGGAAARGRAQRLAVQLIQTAHAHRARPYEVASTFDLTCCMAAYDGESIWVSAAAIPPGVGPEGWPHGSGDGGPRVALNRPSIASASYWSHVRTVRRAYKYAARGLALPGADVDWLESEMHARVTNPAYLLEACKHARLQEAAALLRAGATPFPPQAAEWTPQGAGGAHI